MPDGGAKVKAGAFTLAAPKTCLYPVGLCGVMFSFLIGGAGVKAGTPKNGAASLSKGKVGQLMCLKKNDRSHAL